MQETLLNAKVDEIIFSTMQAQRNNGKGVMSKTQEACINAIQDEHWPFGTKMKALKRAAVRLGVSQRSIYNTQKRKRPEDVSPATASAILHHALPRDRWGEVDELCLAIQQHPKKSNMQLRRFLSTYHNVDIARESMRKLRHLLAGKRVQR